MDREDFMDIVYSELESDFDNCRANRIIEAADEYMSAQSKSCYDEWCTDCKEYDKEKHSCPRWNRVIRQTIQDAQLESCEDAVSRKNCLKALSNMMDTDGFRNGWAVSRANVECMLKSIPPVTPKQRTGYWYPVGMAEAVGGESAQWGGAIAYHRCSECDEQALRDDFEQEVLSKWCPHCGVKMRGTLWE